MTRILVVAPVGPTVAAPVTAPFEAVAGRIPEPGRRGILRLAVPPADGESERRGETWTPEPFAAYGDVAGVERARQAVALGAEALFPTCTYSTGTLDRVREQVGVPVLDPLEELARRLEQLAAPAAAPTLE